MQKKSRSPKFLEIKQCSISSRRLGGTWNDTSIEKAKAFSDPRLFAVVAVWKGASDLLFMVYGQHIDLGVFLLERVKNRKEGSRSTQSIAIETLIKTFNFQVVCPPLKTKESVLEIMFNYKLSLSDYVDIRKIIWAKDI